MPTPQDLLEDVQKSVSSSNIATRTRAASRQRTERKNRQTRRRAISRLTLIVGSLAALALTGAPLAQAITVSTFGPNGTGGSLSGQTFNVGLDGDVFDLEALVGTSDTSLGARLSRDPIPAGLSINFEAMLSADSTDIILRYEISNTSSSAIDDVFFVSFLDAEIAEPTNTFFNEHATTRGTLAAGQSFEVDEPGFASGDIFDNARAGLLDGTNVLAGPGQADDVSLALGWTFGTLDAGELETLEFMISEDGDSLGDFAIDQRDGAPDASPTIITFSSRRVPSIMEPIPEPSALLLFASGAFVTAHATRRRRK